jgi:hypothetical protein
VTRTLAAGGWPEACAEPASEGWESVQAVVAAMVTLRTSVFRFMMGTP